MSLSDCTENAAADPNQQEPGCSRVLTERFGDHGFQQQDAGVERFNGQVALVTGGTRGIGAAIACGLADEGCRVWATGLTANEVAAFETHVRSTDRDIAVRALDVCDAAAISQLVSELPQLDILVNCAGTILRDGREHDPEHFAQVIDVNLNGTQRVCAGCHALLARSGGVVLNTASMLSLFGSEHVPAYSSSKGGIVQLTRSLAIAWARDGIRVNAIAPGWIQTELTRPLYEDPVRHRNIVQRTPAGRWGTPSDLIGPALFLCSADAAFVTGTVLPVDGGYSIC